jgi:putative resolvase
MERMYKPREASNLLGVTVKTIQNWDNDNKIRCERTPYGRRIIPESEIKRLQGERNIRNVVLYARVSTYEQKKDMERQIDFLKMNYPNDIIYKDIGSGMNFKRKDFIKLMKEVKSERVSKIVIVHKDRLVRFGFDFIEEFCSWYGTNIEVLEEKEISKQDELVKDMIAIITSFSSKLYGMRSYKQKKIVSAVKEVINENDNI